MSHDSIAAKFIAYKELAEKGRHEIESILHETPFDRTKKDIQDRLERNQQYRAVILKNVTTFAGLPQSSIDAAARSMEEVFYKKGDAIIQQDDMGDSFFVLEEGVVTVTRKSNPKDASEVPRELARLGASSFFGEISLLTAEPRSATVTVISDEAKCLRMTKMQFDRLLATTNQILEENRKQIGQNVLEAVPLFKSMTMVNKRKLLEAMIPMTYMPASYICRQGTTGNTFFILTEGSCRVTINSSETEEKEVARLYPGDFFGEVALIEGSNRRTANVISIDSVSCLTLSRNDFNRLLKNLKIKLMEHQAMRVNKEQQADRGISQIKQLNTLASKRRISGYNTIGQRDEVRISSILRRLCTFLTESLWNSMYHRMYRDCLLDPIHCNEYGKLASIIVNSRNTRYEAVTDIQEQAIRILEMDPPRRSALEHAFILGLMKQRNQLKDRLCKLWPPHQYATLAKKVKIQRFRYLRKIIEVDTKGTCAFMVLRGSVRIFARVQRGEKHAANPNAAYSKTYYEEDLFPGDIFGETALSGMHTRMITALSMTNVDLLVIEDEDFLSAQDRDSVHMGTEEKSKFLAQVPMFRMWDSYKLLRLAHVLVQEEIENHVVLTRHRRVSKDVFFIVNGKIDIVDSMRKKNVITTLQPYDYLGESGFCNRFVKAINSKVQEEFYAVTASKVEVLVLQEANFLLFDMSSVDLVRASFLAKQTWRRERVKTMKLERAKVRKQYHIMNLEASYLPQLRKQETKDKKRAEKERRRELGHNDDEEDRDTADEDDGDGESDNDHEAVGEFGGYTLYKPKQTLGGNESRDHIFGDLLLVRPQSAAATHQQRDTATTTTETAVAVSPGGRNVNVNPPVVKVSAAVVSKADAAYKGALVHPLDVRMQNPLLWRPPPRPKDRLQNVQDIPVVLNKEFDLLMVSAACRDVRTLQKSQDLILAAKRPLTAKARMQKHEVKYHAHSPFFDPNATSAASSVSGKLKLTTSASSEKELTVKPVSKMKELMAGQHLIDRRFLAESNNNTNNATGNFSGQGNANAIEQETIENFVELTGDEEAALTDVERAAYRKQLDVVKRKRASSNQFLRQSYNSLLMPSFNPNGTPGKSQHRKQSQQQQKQQQQLPPGHSPIDQHQIRQQTRPFSPVKRPGGGEYEGVEPIGVEPSLSISAGGGDSVTEIDEDTNNMEDDDEVQFYIKSLQPVLQRQASAPSHLLHHPQMDPQTTTTHTTLGKNKTGGGLRPIGSARPSSAKAPSLSHMLSNSHQQRHRPTTATPKTQTQTQTQTQTHPETELGDTVSATLSGKSTILTPFFERPPQQTATATHPHQHVSQQTPTSPTTTMTTQTQQVVGVRASMRHKTSPFRRPPALQPSSDPTDNLHCNLPTIPPVNNRFGQDLMVLPFSHQPFQQQQQQQQQQHKTRPVSATATTTTTAGHTYPLRLLSALDASIDDSLEHLGGTTTMVSHHSSGSNNSHSRARAVSSAGATRRNTTSSNSSSPHHLNHTNNINSNNIINNHNHNRVGGIGQQGPGLATGALLRLAGGHHSPLLHERHHHHHQHHIQQQQHK